MAIRTGKDYLNKLRQEGPEVWIGKERIKDVTEHPATGSAAHEIARLYDIQHEDPYVSFMTYDDPNTGMSYGTQFLLPHTLDDLKKRRMMHKLWADSTYGFMGRTTDFIGAMLVGWYIDSDYFSPYDENVRRYFEYVRDNDLFLTHALADPAFDRTKPPSQLPDPFLTLGVVEEKKEGIIVRGAKMLATAAPYADEILVWSFSHNQYTEETARYALAFAIPANTQGLRFICREPYGGSNLHDHPLSSRYDEIDAVVIFDDVLVSWERVFIYKQPQKINEIYKTAMASFSAHQTAVRLWAKLQFIASLARHGAKILKVDQFLHVQDMIGEMTSYVEMTKSAVLAAEMGAQQHSSGLLVPDKTPLIAMRNIANKWYPKVKENLQLIFAGHLMYLPASFDVSDSKISEDIEKYYQGIDVPARHRISVLKAIADIAVDSFGGRHELYERFYAGDPIRLRAAQQYLGYNWADADRLLQNFLEGIGIKVEQQGDNYGLIHTVPVNTRR